MTLTIERLEQRRAAWKRLNLLENMQKQADPNTAEFFDEAIGELKAELGGAQKVEGKPRCAVCGNSMELRFLRRWNDREVCRPCITEMTADYLEGGEHIG
ncbi:hypothetical protein UY286_21665 [Paenibacillus polymyxa]|uniref:hypothetical protein n=1 Tax=Paenibacillus polymyxa TaxID=1406 RepID=UPI002AB44C37|nr:hypothetical protein [Paenibacillus polymyxa]MDY7993351.1 hypothetical protein [Paenibacillus polymyxa]MDY8120048.1 hypothetical protein [Paenibacillus polymyxa]